MLLTTHNVHFCGEIGKNIFSSYLKHLFLSTNESNLQLQLRIKILLTSLLEVKSLAIIFLTEDNLVLAVSASCLRSEASVWKLFTN